MYGKSRNFLLLRLFMKKLVHVDDLVELLVIDDLNCVDRLVKHRLMHC